LGQPSRKARGQATDDRSAKRRECRDACDIHIFDLFAFVHLEMDVCRKISQIFLQQVSLSTPVERKVWTTSRLGYWKIPLMGDGSDIASAHSSNGGNGKLTGPPGK